MNTLRLGLVVVSIFCLFAPLRGDDVNVLPQSRGSDIDSKLRSLVVSVDFNNATIEDAAQALTNMSKELDPSHREVQFIIQPEASAESRPITLKLNKVPLGEAIRYTCLLGNVGYKVSDKFVSLTPVQWTGQELVKRTYHVDPNFVETAQRTGVIPSTQTSP